MVEFIKHTEETVPDKSKSRLSAIKKQLGFIPNLISILSDSPALLETYLYGMEQVHTNSIFTDKEVNVLLLAISSENLCGYCTKAHSKAALAKGLTQDLINNILDNNEIANKKLNVLAKFSREVVKSRGFMSDDFLKEFMNAGYSNQHILEVILLAGLKTLTNYSNHVAHTEVDSQFK